jgi:hypothetical protein
MVQAHVIEMKISCKVTILVNHRLNRDVRQSIKLDIEIYITSQILTIAAFFIFWRVEWDAVLYPGKSHTITLPTFGSLREANTFCLERIEPDWNKK